MNKLKEHRLLILCCVLFFIFGVLVSQVEFEKWLPNTSSDLAAWVQAIGAIVAMGVAIRLAGLPFKQERRNVVISLRMFHKNLIEAVHQVDFGVKNDMHGAVVLARVCLENCLPSIASARYELLPAEACNAFFRIRDLYAQLAYVSRLYEDGLENGVQKNKHLARDIPIVAGEAMSILRRDSNVIWNELNGVASVRFDFDKLVNDAEVRAREMVKKGEGIRNG